MEQKKGYERAITWRKIILTCPFNVSVNSNWVHPPGQPPGISSKKLPEGSGFDFSKLPVGWEFHKDQDFVESESETSKNSMDQFIQVKTKTKLTF